MITSSLHSRPLAPTQLINSCIAGSKAAQVELYRTYAPTMFAVCLRYANDHHSAQDFLQEGFIKVFQNIDRFKGTGSFEGWLKRIFINTAIEQLRKNKKFAHADLDQEYQISNNDLNALDNLAVEDLLQLLKKLPEGYRTIFNLYVIEGYNHKEIADMLGISDGTSKSQLARARKTIQNLIQEQKSTEQI